MNFKTNELLYIGLIKESAVTPHLGVGIASYSGFGYVWPALMILTMKDHVPGNSFISQFLGFRFCWLKGHVEFKFVWAISE